MKFYRKNHQGLQAAHSSNKTPVQTSTSSNYLYTKLLYYPKTWSDDIDKHGGFHLHSFHLLLRTFSGLLLVSLSRRILTRYARLFERCRGDFNARLWTGEMTLWFWYTFCCSNLYCGTGSARKFDSIQRTQLTVLLVKRVERVCVPLQPLVCCCYVGWWWWWFSLLFAWAEGQIPWLLLSAMSFISFQQQDKNL